MDPQVKVALIGAAGGMFAALLTALGVWLTVRQSRTAVRSTAQIETAKIEAGAYERAQRIWQGTIDDLEDRVTALQAEMREQRETHSIGMQALQARLDAMEERRVETDTLIRRLWSYVRRLRRALRDAQLSIPEPPDGLVLDPID